jgi:hypothetical protein
MRIFKIGAALSHDPQFELISIVNANYEEETYRDEALFILLESLLDNKPDTEGQLTNWEGLFSYNNALGS